jgi:hypothetical protein
MKLSDIYKDAKLMIAIGTTIVAMAGVITVYAMLPKRVAAVEQDTKVTADKVQNLAATVDKYVAVNEERRASDKKQQDMMLELIKASSEHSTREMK